MVYACCVPSCNNNGKTKNISLHSFTKSPNLGKLWIQNINNDTKNSKLNQRPLTVTKYTKICSAHFPKSDYTVGSGFHRLSQDAVPTIFPWTSKRIKRETKAKHKEYLIKLKESIELEPEECERLKAKADDDSDDNVMNGSSLPQENSSEEIPNTEEVLNDMSQIKMCTQ